jgi:hypothetical protein
MNVHFLPGLSRQSQAKMSNDSKFLWVCSSLSFFPPFGNHSEYSRKNNIVLCFLPVTPMQTVYLSGLLSFQKYSCFSRFFDPFLYYRKVIISFSAFTFRKIITNNSNRVSPMEIRWVNLLQITWRSALSLGQVALY